jgi:hypothetical protein
VSRRPPPPPPPLRGSTTFGTLTPRAGWCWCRPPTFSALAQLKAHVTRSHKVQMCDICLEGRKVFLSEQEMYSKADLERHYSGAPAHSRARRRFSLHPW